MLHDLVRALNPRREFVKVVSPPFLAHGDLLELQQSRSALAQKRTHILTSIRFCSFHHAGSTFASSSVKPATCAIVPLSRARSL